MKEAVVCLCDWLPPDFGAVGQYTLQYAQQRARNGDTITVYGLSSTRESVLEDHEGGPTIIRLFATTYDRSSFRQRAWWTLQTNLKLVRRALADMRRADTIVFTGSPPFLLHLMAPLNYLLRKKLIYRITDFFPECLMAEYPRAPLALRLFHRLTIFWRKRADILEVLGEDQRKRLLEQGVPDSKVVLRRDKSPVEISSVTKSMARPASLSGKKILLYSGNLGVAHDYETFLTGYSRHHKNGTGRVGLWLNAQGAGADVLEKKLENAQLPFYRSRPVPLEQLASLLVAPDAHLITLRERFMGYVLPSKVYGCIDSGKPIIYIGPQGSDVHLLCRQARSQDGYTQIQPGDAEAVARALERV